MADGQAGSEELVYRYALADAVHCALDETSTECREDEDDAPLCFRLADQLIELSPHWLKPSASDPETLARRFHEAYERLAPSFGYETREASAKPWAQVPENNRRLMIAVCREIAAPEPSTAEVLAGLREEMQALARHGAETTIDQSWLKWFHEQHVALVEAAQQRLADRGQSGMPDEFEPYLAEAMKRPGFRAAYEAALREEENTDG